MVLVYDVVLYAHVIGALLFMLGHGVATFVALALRNERDPSAIGPLLNLSARVTLVSNLALVALIITGAAMGILAEWWQRPWYWAALILFFAISFAMTPLAATPFTRIRKALDLRPPPGFKFKEKPERPPTPEELEGLLARTHPLAMGILGIGGTLVLVWLMMFKPF